MTTRFGTSHFVSFAHALRYYHSQEPGAIDRSELRDVVQGKLDDGEISIGPPELKDDETLRTDAAGQYFVEVA